MVVIHNILILTIGFHKYVESYKLNQVLILGRHGIRAPFGDNIERITNKKWPQWSAIPGNLTPKGALMEENMGKYFRELFKTQNFITEQCPMEDSVFILANNTQRTKETAMRFVKSFFSSCNISVHDTSEIMTDLFKAMVRNTSKEFHATSLKEIEKIKKSLQLSEQYLKLNKILNIKESKMCQYDKICDLSDSIDRISIRVGVEPEISGPLLIGYIIVDTMLMGFYDGLPLQNIAWGALKKQEELKPLIELMEAPQFIKFENPFIARDLAKPLLQFMAQTFLSETPKFTLLVGHDTNIKTVLAAIGVKPYDIPNQYEKVPVSGKLVLQKWLDEDLGRDLFKAQFIYYSLDQIRYGKELSLENSPESITLEFKHCPVDENGFCLWEDFMRTLLDVL